jgi:cytokinesis protein
MKDARRKADQMQLYLDEMTRTYDDIMIYFGEDNGDENARRDFFAKLAGFVTEWKKSREKNMSMEETRRRNEASMARKRANQAFASTPGSSGTETPGSPTSSGAMDSLLEKLRAAAPQARDQRDRRRRARLKEKHQVRIASGQKIPDLPLNNTTDTDRDLLSAEDIPEEGSETTSGKADVSESEDVADRAATLLQGLRSESAAPDNDENELRVRRRRDNADEERRNRRMRRRTAQQSSNADGRDSPIASPEEPVHDRKPEVLVHNPETAPSTTPAESIQPEHDVSPSELIPPPTIVISPTSDADEGGGGEGTAQQPVEIPD